MSDPIRNGSQKLWLFIGDAETSENYSIRMAVYKLTVLTEKKQKQIEMRAPTQSECCVCGWKSHRVEAEWTPTQSFMFYLPRRRKR